MKIGKVPQDVLHEKVLGTIQYLRPEVLLHPNIGEDCSAIQLESDEVMVLSTDPITGATANIGSIAVTINANDLASSGAEPIGILVTLLLPPETEVEDIHSMMQELSEASRKMKMEILGGHTEVTDAVNRPIISVTAVGKAKRSELVMTKGSQPGDDLIMTKWAGVEGTAIIAEDCKGQLEKVLTEEDFLRAKDLLNCLSVVPEGKVAREYDVHAMHDVTEGGILGAAWEMATCAGVGLTIDEEAIPILGVTKKICNHYEIDPLKLISSGSMLIAVKDGEELVDQLDSICIKASIIGKVTSETSIKLRRKGQLFPIDEPEADELYKVV